MNREVRESERGRADKRDMVGEGETKNNLISAYHTQVVTPFAADTIVVISLIMYHICWSGTAALLSVKLVIPETVTQH